MLFLVLVMTIYVVIVMLSCVNTIAYIVYPHSEKFESILLNLALVASTIIVFIMLSTDFLFFGNKVTTTTSITETARVDDKVTVSHRGTKLAKVKIDNIRVSDTKHDYVRMTDEQTLTHSKILQAIRGNKVVTHDKHYTVYIGDNSTLKDLNIKFHKNNR